MQPTFRTVALFFSLALGYGAHAQDYPAKPIRVFLEFAAGAAGDIFMRSITDQMARGLGQPVVIENRPGAGGVLAAESAIRSTPDGYSMLGATANALVLRPHLVKTAVIDPIRDLTPIAGLWVAPSVILSSVKLPVQSMKELIEYARANPDKVAFGTTGVGGGHHFNAEQLQILTGIRLRHVPYKASAQSFVDLVAGEIPMIIGNATAAKPFIKPDRVRVLAVVEGRTQMFPNLAALPELVPGFNAVPNWTALFAPAKLPPAIQRRLNAEANRAMTTAEVKDVTRDADLIIDTPDAFQARMKEHIVHVAKIAKAANIQVSE